MRVKYEAIDISVRSREEAMKSFPRVDCDFFLEEGGGDGCVWGVKLQIYTQSHITTSEPTLTRTWTRTKTK